MGSQNGRVKLNVGGRVFETTSMTLANAGRNSMLGAMFDATWNLPSPENNDGHHHFLDRNPDSFAVILDFLRTGELYIPANLPEKLLYREALYYGLLDSIRAAKWGPFDGNLLKLSRSIAFQSIASRRGYGGFIRGGPEGGCCLARDCMVSIFDWMMDEHPPINLGYQLVNDVGWVDAGNVIVGVRVHPNGGSGMGLFNCSTGELRNKFEVCHEGQVRSYTAGALCFDRDNKVVSSCKGGSRNEDGVGVWDLDTGEHVDFFYEPNEWSLGDATKLQWLDGCNSLLVASFQSDYYVEKKNCHISLLDFRDKSMVWSWSDRVRRKRGYRRIHDVLAIDDNRSVCVADWQGGLGILDLRSTTTTDSDSGIKWYAREQDKSFDPDRPYPKLALHGGQLFSSFRDCISVMCVSNLVLTSTLKRSKKDIICDISISGDRLFALHREEENVFDIWETPTSPII